MPVSALSTGNVAAVYVEHHRWLLGWLRRKLNGADQAADLAHDTFVRVLSRHEARQDLAMREPRAYLTTVARNLLINHVRRQSLEQAYLDVLALVPQAQALAPETRLAILDTLHDIDAMLDGLPARVREAFLLSQLEGLGYAAIGARLGVSERTVKRYMAQAFEQSILLVAA
ncbi:sigma-70 family RNA polymerase sigma factor [Janthinobacterium fluminis]|uniref:Sigma-70 family RNA polymerase sigma factor n=1 Tax=Janthinobacterium fluminis TaxID=2987524 RepID=A0ABT5JYM4_9BURK|nr:sigma-70 family RNA polymerase sigma factor [Janthinobacterium fluminis]MDC8757831.1 sigma-70 family RNA polymerase sigma factor [Janthinobacterium fluminis]